MLIVQCRSTSTYSETATEKSGLTATWIVNRGEQIKNAPSVV